MNRSSTLTASAHTWCWSPAISSPSKLSSPQQVVCLQPDVAVVVGKALLEAARQARFNIAVAAKARTIRARELADALNTALTEHAEAAHPQAQEQAHQPQSYARIRQMVADLAALATQS